MEEIRMYTYMLYMPSDLLVNPKTLIYLKDRDRELSGKIAKRKLPKRISNMNHNIRPTARKG